MLLARFHYVFSGFSRSRWDFSGQNDFLPTQHRLAILGPSGSGKSSLALAGPIPALRAGKVEGSAGWPIVVFRPGSNPLESLAIELSRAGLAESSAAAIQGLISSLLHDRTTLHLTARLALKAPAARLVVLADQFEEVFTLCTDGALRRALIENLLHAATVVGGPMLVLLTMRADFLDKCALYSDLAAALSDGQELVGPMSKDELRLAIEHPAALAGCTLEPGLTDLLLQDVRGQSGALPLLEYALLDLWRQRQGNRLTIASYRDMGGVQGALEHRADAKLEEFRSRPGELEICRRIFLRLTQPGEGTEDTKRRAAFDELIAYEAEQATVEEVVRELADARLITTEGREGTARSGAQPGEAEGREHPPQQPGERQPPRYVEVAHEALIRGWKQLREWIDADRAGLRTHRQLTEAAREWQNHNRDESYLYIGSRLDVAREWSEAHAPDVNPLEREFLHASLALRRRRESAELEAARRLAEEAESRRQAEEDRAREAELREREAKLREQEQTASALRLRRRAWLLLAISIAAILIAAIAAASWNEAKKRTGIAEEQSQNAQSSHLEAVHNLKIANDNLTEAKRQQGRAEANLAKVRSAIEKHWITQLGDNWQEWQLGINNPSQEFLLKHLFDKSLIFFQSMIDPMSGDLLTDIDKARLYRSIGFIHRLRGRNDEAQSMFKQATSCYERLAAAFPNMPVYRQKLAESNSFLGSVLNDNSQWDEAIAALSKAVELDPKNADAQNNLGWALGEKGRYDEAIPILQKAIELDPKHANAHNNLGWRAEWQGAV